MKPEVLKKRVAYESRRLLITEEDLRFADGHEETWEYVELKGHGGAKVLALTEKKELVLVREYRGAAGRFIIRAPTGSIEEGETPEQAAKRELAEEAGFCAHKIVRMEEVKTSGSYVKFKGYLLFASGLKETKAKRDPGEQGMEILTIPLEEVYKMVDELKIDDPKTIYAILRLKNFLRESQPC